MSTQTCKDCGETSDPSGVHYPGLVPLTEEILERKIRLRCGGCGSDVQLVTIKGQGLEKWLLLRATGQVFCPHCSHAIETTFN